MPLAPGAKLGPYEVLAPIGAGGMGEVYRGKDTRLGREVALKILPATLVNDPAYMTRFRREAQVLASLNHPHIAIVHGLEDNAIVMELVDGVTLAERIAQGPLPIDEAIDIARQIAEAFEYAHEKGVVHRDLKPANVKLTPEGVVKVLDFGIARMADAPPSPGNPESSPTLTLPSTQAGMIMGTAAYMSPEQAAGKAVDRRADIWSFGVVLWEMLTGRKLFAGETVSHTLADVLRAPIEFRHLPTGTSSRIRTLLERCLDRNPKTRLRDIGEARILLAGPAAIEPAAAAPSTTPSRLPWLIAAAATLALIASGAALWKATRPAGRPLLYFSDDLGPEAIIRQALSAILSPDGTRIVFATKGKDGHVRLATRLLRDSTATPIAGTEEANFPFFSPDGQWIAFFAGGQLKKVPVTGGAAVRVADAPNGRGGSWSDDGTIVFTPTQNTGLWRVPDTGGTAQELTKAAAKGERTHRFAQVLPGAQSVIFTTAIATNYDEANIAIASLRTSEWRNLTRGYFGRYAPSGHLLFMRDGAMVGAPFDLASGQLRGSTQSLIESIAENPNNGAGQFDISQSGTLAYLSGRSRTADRQVAWVDRTGKSELLIAAPGPYSSPTLSPDGAKLVLTVGRDISVYDLERKTLTKLTFTGQNGNPTWSADGKYIAYTSTDRDSRILWIRADGSGEPVQLLAEPLPAGLRLGSFSPDGRRLAFTRVTFETGVDLWTVPLDLTDPDHPKPGKPEPFLRSSGSDVEPAFSPDGRWLAYISSESGIFELFVRPFPGPGGRWQITTNGAVSPAWTRDGRALLYVDPTGHVIEVPYIAKGDSFNAAPIQKWTGVFQATSRRYTITPSLDGKRVATTLLPDEFAPAPSNLHITFLVNYFEELERRLPLGSK